VKFFQPNGSLRKTAEKQPKTTRTQQNRGTPMKLKAAPKLKAVGIATIAVALFAAPAVGHHSFAMFDAAKLVTLDGTVKEFQWTNPHAWIHLNVPDADGKSVTWAIEMNGPSGIARDGWRPKTLTPGMKIKVIVHPLRDGNPGGQYLHVTLPDGKQMGNPTGRGPAPGPAEPRRPGEDPVP